LKLMYFFCVVGIQLEDQLENFDRLTPDRVFLFEDRIKILNMYLSDGYLIRNLVVSALIAPDFERRIRPNSKQIFEGVGTLEGSINTEKLF
jgi:hypothetical protein